MDTASRLGGDEFLVVLPELENGKQTLSCANRLLQAINQDVSYQQQILSVGCSIGAAIYPDDGDDLQSIRKCADMRMYEIKQSGKNGVNFG